MVLRKSIQIGVRLITKQEIQRQQKFALAEKAVENGIIPKLYTKEDFMFTTEPFAYLESLTSPFDKQRAMMALCDMASAVGYNSFKKTYDDYRKTERGIDVAKVEGNTVALSTFGLPDAPEYAMGFWTCDEAGGIYRFGEGGQEVVACSHIIFPLRRLVNAYTGAEKIEIAYKRGTRWRTTTKPKSTISSANKIIELADEGVGVTSDNAKDLVKYLSDVEALNYDIIPEIKAFDRLGWMDDYQSFSPYLKGAVFDDADAFRGVYDAVTTHHGSFDAWMRDALAIRKTSPVQTKMALAASLASAIVKPCGANPFFLHLWGGTEAGKTVALMFAASVWADPECGRYWKTFDSTAVGQEKMAGFLGNLPLIIDELMLIRDKKSFDDIVYRLSEGQGRTRGNKEGGVQRQETWRLAVITTGEQPLSSAASGGGAVNRVIDCECTTKLFKDPHWAANSFRQNYGWLGERWISWLMQDDHLSLVKSTYSGFYRTITDKHITTEKQASAAALILTADSFATEAFFQDGQAISIDEIESFLTSAREVDQNERAYEYILETIAMNDFHFSAPTDSYVEQWGWKDVLTNTVCINRTIFGKLMSDGGFDARGFLSWALRMGIVHGSINHQTGRQIPTKVAKKQGTPIRYVELDCNRHADFLAEEPGDWPEIVQDEQNE